MHISDCYVLYATGSSITYVTLEVCRVNFLVRHVLLYTSMSLSRVPASIYVQPPLYSGDTCTGVCKASVECFHLVRLWSAVPCSSMCSLFCGVVFPRPMCAGQRFWGPPKATQSDEQCITTTCVQYVFTLHVVLQFAGRIGRPRVATSIPCISPISLSVSGCGQRAITSSQCLFVWLSSRSEQFLSAANKQSVFICEIASHFAFVGFVFSIRIPIIRLGFHLRLKVDMILSIPHNKLTYFTLCLNCSCLCLLLSSLCVFVSGLVLECTARNTSIYLSFHFAGTQVFISHTCFPFFI